MEGGRGAGGLMRGSSRDFGGDFEIALGHPVRVKFKDQLQMPSYLFLILIAATAISYGDGATARNLKQLPGCPYCDSSVYSYCSDKLLHDACCCLDPYENQLPLECKLADCSFLHANSCRDHHLITRCCCNRIL